MVERTVLVKLKDRWANDEGRQDTARHTIEAIARVPGVRGVNVGLPADEKAAGVWDLLIRVDFDRIEDVPGYVADPGHRAYVDDFLAPRTEVLKAWNFIRTSRRPS